MWHLDLNSEYLELGFGRGPLSAASRAKRMRTSFKHHQLRTMKSYFAINHNPDAKDLKQLSQKTGLPKRVLQVSFHFSHRYSISVCDFFSLFFISLLTICQKTSLLYTYMQNMQKNKKCFTLINIEFLFYLHDRKGMVSKCKS